MKNIEISTNRFKAFFEKIKETFKKFPFTMSVITITTLFISIFFNTDFLSSDIAKNIIYFFMYFGIGSFFCEALRIKNKKLKIFLLILDCIISAVFILLKNTMLDDNFEFLLDRIILCYTTLMIVSAIYILYKRSSKSIEQYILEIFYKFFKTSLVYFVLSVGIAIITAVFVYLIAGDYKLIFRLEIILCGIYYLPAIINNFVNSENEVSTFFKRLIKYVLGILVFVAFIIIYIYMIKIFALKEIPSNQIFRILFALFICGLPIWTMIHSFNEEKNLWQSIFNKLPIAFIPFIFLQIYSLVIRINANGVTPIRYVGIMILIFEIIYILLYIFKNQKQEYIVLVFEVLLLITVLIPGINMYTVSNISQANRLQLFKEKQELSKEEKQDVYGAYDYLRYSENGEEYINKILTKDDIEVVKSFISDYYDYNDYENIDNISIFGSIGEQKINIKGYSTLYAISYYESYNFHNINLKRAKIEFKDYTQKIEVNLSVQITDYIDKYITNGSEYFEEYFKENNEIKIDDNRKIILDNISIYYDNKDEKINSCSFSGYLLEK